MIISYFDESGDDGWPSFSSPLFVLTNVYMPSTHWRKNHEQFDTFRSALKENYDWPKKREIHFQKFLTDKNPYHGIYEPALRREISFKIVEAIAQLDIRIINTVIDKTAIKRSDYNVLENAFKYNVQRLETHVRAMNNHKHFLIITDEGRLGKMRMVTRKMSRFNYLPSKFGGSYRDDLKTMIEDPLPKNSSESHFIQIADVVSFWIYLFACRHLSKKEVEWANRVKRVFSEGDEIKALEMLKPVFNTKASNTNEFGIVQYPR